MKIVISGASGFVGGELVSTLQRRGAEVTTLVRKEPDPGGCEHRWLPEQGELDPVAISGADAVINLNGRNISQGRWTDEVKRDLRSSRLDATRTIVNAIGRAEEPPPLLINISATGFYGDRGDDELDESTSRGSGFLSDLAADWEAAAAEAISARTRVVFPRLGMVLGNGGALAKMLTPFKLGFGGPMGSGRQFWPWISVDDVVGAVWHILEHDDIRGPVNLVAPEETTSKTFAHALGEHLGIMAVLPTPAFALKLALGEMAGALLLSSQRVKPTVLHATGYEFKAPTLAEAFRQILG